MNEPQMTDAEISHAIASAEALHIIDRCIMLHTLWWETATEDARQAIDAAIIRAISDAEAFPTVERCDALLTLWCVEMPGSSARQAVEAAIIRAITEPLSRDERRVALQYLWWKTAAGSDARRETEDAYHELYEAN